MKIKFWTGPATLAVLLIISISQTTSEKTTEIKSGKPLQPLHLRQPVLELTTRLQAVIKNFNLFKLISVIGEIGLGCLPGEEVARVEAFIHLIPIDVELLLSKLQGIEPYFTIPATLAEEVCNSTGFRIIHDHLWVNDASTSDLVEFFYYNEFPEAYQAIRQLYYDNKCPTDLIATLPTGPDQTSVRTNTNPKSSNVRDETLKTDRWPFNLRQSEECNLIDILKKIATTGFFELLQFVDSFVTQFRSQPSLHFMVAKIQEEPNGVSFRKFRLLQPIRKIFDDLNNYIISIPQIFDLLSYVKTTTGIDLFSASIVDVVVTVFETLMWQNSDAVPPYIPSKSLRPEEEYFVFY
ncbi:unnamed protein product [Orchesella dallaii]|uniref:Uncharacterized protein n=1 Tax=Orchesella dallaii TaxID=48710 RepID=A0ABP1QLS9_9HEXA